VEVRAVHGQQEVELREVGVGDLAGEPAKLGPAPPGGGGRALVGRAAHVVGGGARAVDLDLVLQPRVGDEAAHDALGGRRAADVAQADEEDPHARAGYTRDRLTGDPARV